MAQSTMEVVNGAASGQQYADFPLEDDTETPHASPHDSPLLSPKLAEGEETSSKSTAPIQKRRRVTRACDECRRKKIKCDGKQPCTHCTVYSYECTYDQPSNRRRNAAPQYIEALEAQLKRAQAILKLVLPGADLNDPSLETKLQQGLLSPSPQVSEPSPVNGNHAGPVQNHDPATDPHLESMVKSTGQLDLDEQGHLEYHGHSSGLSFVRRMREHLGDVMGPEGHATPFVKSRPMSIVLDSPHSATDSPWDPPAGTDLPTREVAYELCDIAINDAISLLRFVHFPTFKKQLDAIYDKPPETWGNDENAFLPLLYAAMSLGTLFAKDEESDLDRKGYESAIERGFKYFKASRSMMDIADCRDLRQLQAILFMIMFLQSSAKLSVCYAYIGVALRSALRMGLHRSFPDNFNPVMAETRKRVFWVIRKMDTYVGALLGLPHSIMDDDIDQEDPAEVDDEYITEEGILEMPEGSVSYMAGANAHTNLVAILSKIVKYVYPLKGSTVNVQGKPVKSYSVSYARILEIEQDLLQWQDTLLPGLKPGGEAPLPLVRVQHMLRLSYAHAQMMLYRPFLHYVSQAARHSRVVDKRSFACAAACVSVSRNIIHIAVEMKKRHLLIGAYWFTMYTTFFAILSLVFYALENPENDACHDVLRVAKEGKDTLEALAKRSMAADRCTATLVALFEQLPSRFSRVRQNSLSRKRRQESSPHPSRINGDPKSSEPRLSNEQGAEPRRASTYPTPSISSPFAHVPPQSLDSGAVQAQAPHPYLDIHPLPSPTTTVPTPSLSSVGLSRQPDSYPMSPTNFTDPSFPLADISTVMFPPGDPFAYPDQSVPPAQAYDQYTKNLNPNFFGYSATANFQRGSMGADAFSTGNYFLMPNGGSEQSPTQDADMQLLGPTPFYLMSNPSALQQSTQPPQQQQANQTANANRNGNAFVTREEKQTFANQTTNGFPGHLNLATSANLQLPNMNLDQLLGGEEWVGLDRTTSGMGTYMGPPNDDNPTTNGPTATTNCENIGFNGGSSIYSGDNAPLDAKSTTFKTEVQSTQDGVSISGEDGLHYEEFDPEALGWGLDGFPLTG